MFQELLHLIQLRLMYIRDLESWLKWIAISLSVVVAFVVFEGVEQQVRFRMLRANSLVITNNFVSTL